MPFSSVPHHKSSSPTGVKVFSRFYDFRNKCIVLLSLVLAICQKKSKIIINIFHGQECETDTISTVCAVHCDVAKTGFH